MSLLFVPKLFSCRPHKWVGPWCVVALAGCAAPAVEVEAPLGFAVPAVWSGQPVSADSPAVLGHWWRRFDDPVLTQLVDQALAVNTSVVGAQAALRQTQAIRDVAAAALSPMLGVVASAQYAEGGRGESSSATTSQNTYRTEVNVAWSPDLSGGLRLAFVAADATSSASTATLGDVQVAVASEVALTYLTLRSGQVRLAIARANLSNQLDTLQITHWRQQAGLLTVLDTEQARAAAEQTRALLPPLQTGVRLAGHALDVLTGVPPHAALFYEGGQTSHVPQANMEATLGLPAQLLLQRPSVVAAHHQLTAAHVRLDASNVAGLPSAKLTGSLGLSALTLASLTSSAAVVRAVLGSFNLPLWDGGAIHAQSRAQRALWEQAHQTYKAAVLTALQDVEDQLATLQGDRERLRGLVAAADAATQAAVLARQRYDSGLTDFQTVLETQRNRLTTQDGVAAAEAALSADQVRLFRALGGGWQPDLPTPRPLTPTAPS